MYAALSNINLIYTNHVLSRRPVKSGVYIVTGVEFHLVDGGNKHYSFSIKIEDGKIMHNFQKKSSRGKWSPSSISTIRKLLTQGE